MTYRQFFRTITGGYTPFPFQERFRKESARWVILQAPTGLGKTEAAVVSWLHRRLLEPATTARRLVCVLPARALTGQFADKAEGLTVAITPRPRVLRLLGGSADNELTLMPDEPAILVGTLDLLLSRALNRGYARSPFRWPIDFALLNNDCEWIFDEVQLLGDGLATSTQLAAFREQFGCFGPARTCWMSATFDPAWLRTIDFVSFADRIAMVGISDEDLAQSEILRRRVNASKAVQPAPAKCRTPDGTAQFISAEHRAGTISLIIANTVERATDIREALEGKVKADIRLLHSRLRAEDRTAHLQAALGTIPPEGRIIVATQVIEAGIDLDAALLVTDVAPWASLVQRFGRVNRRGEQEGCRIFWVDRPLSAKRSPLAKAGELKPKDLVEICTPYEPAEVAEAAERLMVLKSAASADLPATASLPPWQHVLRKSDLLDLFDTSADLSGNQLDISRFVRSGEDRDVYVAWREWNGETPPRDRIDDRELCPVPIEKFKKAFGPDQRDAIWFWNAAESEWQHPDPAAIYPGIVLLLHSSSGRYRADLGWAGDSKAWVPEAGRGAGEQEGMDGEPQSFLTYRQLLCDHTRDVCEAMERLIEVLAETGIGVYARPLRRAALLHDWGKAHPTGQRTLHKTEGPYTGTEILAKQRRADSWPRHSPRYFRHELASALAMLTAGECDLATYIAAAHHGKVRVTVRSMPREHGEGKDLVRGLAEGDELLACELPGGIRLLPASLRLGPVRIGRGGGPSWTSRVLRLREKLGPFRLAYLEMLLRMADEQASKEAGGRAQEMAAEAAR